MIHELAHVHGDCQIGDGTLVWQFASVIRGARVGARCSIASSAVVDGAVVGDECVVGHGSAINPGVVLGNRVFVGQNAVFCNDRWPSVSKEGFEPGNVTIIVQDGAVIGAGAVILPGVILGKGCLIAANSTVSRSVPAGFMWTRNDETERLHGYTNDLRSPYAGKF